MTVREMLHHLIDRLPDEAVARIEPDIRRICAENDPAWKALTEAPEVDEPFTEEEAALIREAEEEMERGEYVEWNEIRSEFLGDI